jgi:hypothetical protein
MAGQFRPRGVHRCMAVFQTAGAGALPASGTIGPRRSSGRVGLQNRPGGCESLRACQFSWRLGRSSDGAWLKTTRARRATASLHHPSRVQREKDALHRLGDGGHLHPRAGRATDGRPFQTSQQEAGSPAAGLISRFFSVQLGILLPFFSERSLEVRHSAWDRDHACANPAAPTNFLSKPGVWLSQRSTGP